MKETKKKVQAMTNVCGANIVKAFELAAEVHKDQKRKSGEPYIIHPVEVAHLLYEIGADCDVLCAALLHDTIEDSDDVEALESRILRDFGDHVLYMVQALSKDNGIEDKIEQQDKYMEQIIHAFEVDAGVFFIKIADLIHNMSTIVALSPERKKRWIHELKYDYLPLLSEFFHRIPMHYRDTYTQLMDEVQKLVDSFQENSQSA